MKAIRIGTWNVWYAYQSRLKALSDVLEQNQADVWILTETHDDLEPSSCSFVVHSQPRPKNWSGIRTGSRWVSIWSRYPIEQIDFPLSDPERTVVALVNMGDLGQLLVYGTVLPWKGDRQIPGWSEHHRVITQQSEEWATLRNQYPKIPFCIAGDFNTDMESGQRYGTEQGVHALKQALNDCELYCATEPSRFPVGLLDVLPIDHIALPISWQSSSKVISAWSASRAQLSDHSGMVVNVSF